MIQQFATKPDARVSITVAIQAESPEGFDEKTQRDVRENCNVLKNN